MKRVILLIVLCLLVASFGFAQDIEITETRLNEVLTRISYDTGNYTVNMIASVGPDGLLLVDTGEDYMAKELQEHLSALGGEPDVIVLTHSHKDHSGGIPLIGKHSLIVGHNILRERLKTGGDFIFREFPDYVLPDIGISESVSMYFNGEEIRLIPIPRSHDDNDMMVMFMKSKVAHVGDVGMGVNFPSIDLVFGDALHYPKAVQAVRDLLPEDFLVVSGHGRDSTVAALEEYQEMLDSSIALIRTAKEKGMDEAAMNESDILHGYERYEQGYVSKATWINYVVQCLNPDKPTIDVSPLMFYAWKEKGPKGVIEVYRQYKDDPDYYCDSYNVIYSGTEILKKGFVDDAITIIEFSVGAFPEDELSWYFNYSLGRAYEQADNKEKALEAFKRALELNPGDAGIVDRISKLEKSN